MDNLVGIPILILTVHDIPVNQKMVELFRFKLWNSIPNKIHKKESLNTFRHASREYFLKNQFVSGFKINILDSDILQAVMYMYHFCTAFFGTGYLPASGLHRHAPQRLVQNFFQFQTCQLQCDFQQKFLIAKNTFMYSLIKEQQRERSRSGFRISLYLYI